MFLCVLRAALANQGRSCGNLQSIAGRSPGDHLDLQLASEGEGMQRVKLNCEASSWYQRIALEVCVCGGNTPTHQNWMQNQNVCLNPIWPEGDPNMQHMCNTHAPSCHQKAVPSRAPQPAAYLARGRRREGAFWRRPVPEWALLLTAVQLDQVAALRVAGEFTVWRENTRGVRGQAS